MKEGALVLVDCLGFRGIWNRVDPEKLISHLQSMEAMAAARVVPKYSSQMLSYGPLRFHLRSLSDTVALSVQYSADAYKERGDPGERQLNLLASVACESAAALCRLFIDSDMPLPLRGCITFGRHLCDGNFLIGPAVDEAAEYMNEPEGAFIWLLPNVASRLKSFRRHSSMLLGLSDELLLEAQRIIASRGGIEETDKILEHAETGSTVYLAAFRLLWAQVLASPSVIERYPMALKRGATIDADIINPLIACRSDEERKRVISRYAEFLQGDRIDIWMKRQNTMKFLDVAEQATVEWRSALEKGELPPRS